jgi:CysZ protein
VAPPLLEPRAVDPSMTPNGGFRDGSSDALPPRVGFWGAAAAPWRGLGFLITTPRAWPLAAVPMLVSMALISGLSLLSIFAVPALVSHVIGPTETWYGTFGRWVVQILAALAGLIIALLSGMFLAQPLSGVALERLVRLRESSLGITARPKTSLWLDIWRSGRGALIGLIGVAIVLALTLVEIFVAGSTIFVLPIKIFISGLFVSWDLLDYPLSVRDFRLRDRIAWVFTHKREVVGFGSSLALVFLVPCAQLLLLPAGVAGATELVLRSERHDQAKRKLMLPP